MKKLIILLCCTFIITTAFILPGKIASGINGIIDQPQGAKKISAVSGSDTVSTTSQSGSFSIEVKPGNWKLVVEAVPPYKNVVIEGIIVQEGQSTDVGIIKLKSE